MKKASEYRQHADECRRLVLQMPPGEQREALYEMARTWDALDEERSAKAGRARPAETRERSKRGKGL